MHTSFLAFLKGEHVIATLLILASVYMQNSLIRNW